MTLSEWLTLTGTKQTDFAVAIGASEPVVSRIKRGSALASTEVVEEILRVTDGAVTPNDLHATRCAYLRSRGLLGQKADDTEGHAARHRALSPSTLSAPTFPMEGLAA
ncbi:hypothetical protein [Azospirillum sp. sgz302134]